ncbi:hypothetical protein SDC9_57708 [bioreactor metagenome]|uniref:Uncharacterized protein n=1 Tax=bioreactor metagenome TaxID=1076179 RepID=A0A644X5D8_9ZZZZ
MNIEEDLKICKDISEQYKKLTSEDIEGAFKLSQLAISMYDRLNELRLQVGVLDRNDKYTKSDIKEYLRGKMKLMEYIHVQSRAIFISAKADKKLSRY